jgi:DNA polymerase-1
MYFEQDYIDNFYYLGEEPMDGDTLREWVESEPRVIAIDIEAVSKDNPLPIGLCLVSSTNFGFYFPLFPEESLAVPWKFLQDPNVVNIYHNGLFDVASLTEWGVQRDIEDTLIMGRLLCHESNTLADLSDQYGIACPRTNVLLKEHKAKTMLDIPEEVVARHCILHGMATLRLFLEFKPRMYQEQIHSYYKEEMATYPVMVEMSERGVLLDHEERERIEYCLEADLKSALDRCHQEAYFNPGSPQQCAYVLAERGAYNVFTRLPFTQGKNGRPTSNLSTDVHVLERMTDPLSQLILTYRQKKKLLGTYIYPWAGQDRARTKFHLEAATGRPSSTGGGEEGFRNMQNIPGEYDKTGTKNEYNVRGCLLPDSGVWSDGDFSQIEPRSLAYLSGDPTMQHIFSLPRRNPDGTKNVEADIHQQVANEIGKSRKMGKIANLAIPYGGTPETVMEIMKSRDRSLAKEIIDGWARKFPVAWEWIVEQKRTAIRTRVVYSAFGRPMKISDTEPDSRVERCAVDYPCQGTAADILKRGLVLLYNKGMDLALQIHDQYVVDGYHMEDEFACLRSIAPFDTPFEIKYTERLT